MLPLSAQRNIKEVNSSFPFEGQTTLRCRRGRGGNQRRSWSSVATLSRKRAPSGRWWRLVWRCEEGRRILSEQFLFLLPTSLAVTPSPPLLSLSLSPSLTSRVSCFHSNRLLCLHDNPTPHNIILTPRSTSGTVIITAWLEIRGNEARQKGQRANVFQMKYFYLKSAQLIRGSHTFTDAASTRFYLIHRNMQHTYLTITVQDKNQTRSINIITTSMKGNIGDN